jgi:hypothetical protein
VPPDPTSDFRASVPLAMLAPNRYYAVRGQASNQPGGCQPPIETTEEKSMTRFFRRTRGAWLIAGVFAAALIGGVLSQSATRLFSTDEHPLAAGFFKAIDAHASATNSNDALILCTGQIDLGIEGVFTLDPLTGEMRGAVLNPAKAKFVAWYSYPSVAKDFNAAKNPKFLMVTGLGEIRQGPSARAAHCVLYVAEVTSGRVVAYGIPWDSAKAATPQGYRATMQPLDTFNARDVTVNR